MNSDVIDNLYHKENEKGNTSHTNRVTKLLFLSNLIESKEVTVLLDALKILADKGYSFQCNFVGGETKEFKMPESFFVDPQLLKETMK